MERGRYRNYKVLVTLSVHSSYDQITKDDSWHWWRETTPPELISGSFTVTHRTSFLQNDRATTTFHASQACKNGRMTKYLKSISSLNLIPSGPKKADGWRRTSCHATLNQIMRIMRWGSDIPLMNAFHHVSCDEEIHLNRQRSLFSYFEGTKMRWSRFLDLWWVE